MAYFRTYFNRHFKEPIACVSDSMTEDAAVFGGNNNMNLGLQNASALYKPEIIAVSTTCMAEVIGDDLQAFIANAKKDGFVDSIRSGGGGTACARIHYVALGGGRRVCGVRGFSR